MLARFVATAVLLGAAAVSLADAPRTARALVEGGLSVYVKNGANDAIRAWISGSALEGNTQAMTQANSLRQIEDYYGKPLDGTVLKEFSVSPKVRTIYFTINYEKGVAFSRFNAYQKPDGTWIVLSFVFNTEASQVFPSSLLTE